MSLLDAKKELIYKFIDLGMDIDKAYLCSECTYEEMNLLDNDKEFQEVVKVKYALAEYELLMKHNKALDIASDKGNATPIQWRLSKLNPAKYDNKETAPTKEVIESITVNLIGEAPEQDN